MVGAASLWVIGQTAASVAAYSPRRAAFPNLIAFGALLGSGLMIYNINQQAIRQAVTPDRLLGRTQSGVFVLVAVASVVGSLLGGEIGQSVSLRAALAVGVARNLISVVPTIFSQRR